MVTSKHFSFPGDTPDDAIIEHFDSDPDALNLRDEWGDSLLLFAIRGARRDLVAYCIRRGADLDERDNTGSCVLDYAIESSHELSEQILLLLLEAGADPNNDRENRCFDRPLHKAAAMGKVEMARALLDHRARIDDHLGIDDGETPLCYAVRWNHVEMVEFLLSRGAATSYFGAASPPASWVDKSHPNGSRIAELLSAGRKPKR